MGSSLQVLSLVAVSVALFAGPFLQLVERRELNGNIHVALAERIAETGVVYPGHFLYHVLTVAVHAGLPVSWLQAHLLVVVAARTVLAVILWRLVRGSLAAGGGGNGAVLAVVIPLGLMFASAVSFLTWPRGNYYIGYVTPNVYVSQTLVVLQPLALVTFFVVLRVLGASSPGPAPGAVTGMAALALASSLAKPSFAMVLIPAVASYLVLRRRSFAPGSLRRTSTALALGLALPVLLSLVWVYLSTFLPVQRAHALQEAGFGIVPFKVMRGLQGRYDGGGNVMLWLLAKLALSIVFPGAVAVAYFSQIRHDARFVLAWLQFGFGLVFMYLFTELPRYGSGNFTWSAHIAIFILFVVSTLILLEQTLAVDRAHRRAAASTTAARLCVAAFVVHVVAGYGMYVHPAVN